MTNTTPILAIDIDGVLAPRVHNERARKNLQARGFRSIEWRGQMRRVPGSGWYPYTDLYLNPTHGAMLAKFSRDHDVELVWASLWEHNANTIIGPVLGLPRLPFVDFHGHTDGPAHWKFRAMRDYAQGRPLAWLDDSFTRHARKRVTSGFDLSRRNLPTLLQEVDEAVGVTQHDLDVVASWLRTVSLAWPMGSIGMSEIGTDPAESRKSRVSPTDDCPSLHRARHDAPTLPTVQPKSPVWHRGSRRRSTRRRSVFVDTDFSSMSEEEFIDAIALDGSPPF